MKIKPLLWHLLCHKTESRVLNIMKVSLFLTFVCVFQMYAFNMKAQNSMVELTSNSTTIEKLFSEIEKQTGYLVVYDNKDLVGKTMIRLSKSRGRVNDLLNEIIKGTNLKYEYTNRYIVFSKVPVSSLPAEKTVKGIVKDTSGEPIIGASILLKGKNAGTITDINGRFSIEVDNNDILEISYVGYQTQRLTVGGKKDLEIILKEDNMSLDEVVVVGYGTVKKSDLTGAALRVSEKEIKSRPVANALESMQGKIAGVDITSTERPGTVPSITIRGVRSLLASNSPLYVVDGIPLMTGGIDNINPSDIESIDVLKDASATAIYGSRGANGVVIITTKQGKAGKFSLSYSGSVTAENIENKSTLTNASEYIDYRRWAYYYSRPSVYPRGDQPNQANDYKIFHGANDPSAWNNIMKGWNGNTWDGSKVSTTDWSGMVTRTGITQEHTLSASGGTDKMKGYFSFGYLKNKGTQLGQDFERYTGKANLDITPLPWFSMGGSVNVSYGIQEYGQSKTGANSMSSNSGIYASARANLPYAVPYDENGERILYPGGDDAIRTVANEWNYSQDQRVTFRTFGSLYAQVDFGKINKSLDGLKYRMNFGPDFSMYRDGIYLDKLSVIRTGSSFASLSKSQTLSFTLDNLIYYDKIFGKHSFGLTLLQSMTKYNTESNSMSADNVPFSSQKWNALNNSDVPELRSWASGLIERQLMSYMARINYNFNQRYLLTASGRWDGASQLAEGHKWAFFPSLALGWRLDQEDFLQNVDWIDQLKIRLGYGTTGNSAIGAYATKGGLVSLFYPYYTEITSGSLPSSVMANKNLGWERTSQLNLGIDFAFFKNRISGVLDIYKSKTKDLLMNMTVPSVSGYMSTYANVGETSNKGVDLTLNTINIKMKDFQWSTSLNVSWQKDKIKKLVTASDDINNNWFIGEQIGVIYGYKAAGIWQKEDAEEMAKYNANGNKFKVGQIRIVDQPDENGKIDYKIDANHDRVIIGNTRPNWIFGMTNNFTYKNIDLSVFIYGRFGYKYNTGGEYLDGRYNVRKLNYYTETNTKSDYQRPEYTMGTGDSYYASLGYKDGSFLKIRNISLGYTFPKSLIDRWNINNLKLYVQVMNPGTIFSKIDFLDMDTQTASYNRGVTAGININF